MSKKTDFTAEEWETLRDAPLLVMLSVAAAGSSGPFGSLKEAIAPIQAIVDASEGNNELLRSVCHREELKAAQQSLRGFLKSSDSKTIRESLQALAAEKAGEANSFLKRKGAPGELDAYRALLVDLADRTAKAAKEGGFLGFGGEWVSEGERTVIAKISKALEVQSS